MLKETLTPHDMRQTIVDLMNLPETEFIVVSEVIHDLMQQTARRPPAAEMLAEARRQAATLQHLPRAELFARLRAAHQALRDEIRPEPVTDEAEAFAHD